MRLLQGLGYGGGRRETPVFAVVCKIALPKRFDHGQHFLHVLPAIGFREPGKHAVELPLIGAGSDPEFESAPAVEVEQGRFTGQVDRVPVRCHHDGGAETNPLGVRCPPGQNLERVGGDGHFECVVFRCPDDVKSSCICHLHHLERVAGDFIHVGVGMDPFHVDGQLKFH